MIYTNQWWMITLGQVSQATSPPPVDFWHSIFTDPAATLAEVLLLLLFGAFGGVLGVLSDVPLRKILKDGLAALCGDADGHRIRFGSGLIVGLLYGSGGALAFGLILALDDKFNIIPLTPKTIIIIISTAIAAGFSGPRILRHAGDRLEQEIRGIKKEVDNVRDEVTNVRAETDRAAQRADNIAFASGILPLHIEGDEHKELRQLALARLEESRREFPDHRILGVYMGRLHRQLGDLPSAIKVLTGVLDERRRKKITPGLDDAVLYFNRACYKSLESTNTGANKTELLAAAWDDLCESIRLDKNLKQDATQDADLAALLTAEKRKTLEGLEWR